MDYWIVSTGLLWIVVLLILVYLVALTRQIGVLHLRLQPTGARMTNAGLDIGEYAPFQVLTTISGTPVYLGPNTERNTILIFVSTSCPACSNLLASLRSFIREMNEQIVLVFGAADQNEVKLFLAHQGVPSVPVIISPEIVTAFRVSGVPYAFALDKAGLVRGKGIVNTAEHVESLANTIKYGVPSMEQFIPVLQTDVHETVLRS